jgi:lipoprotein-releasing system permease protein
MIRMSGRLFCRIFEVHLKSSLKLFMSGWPFFIARRLFLSKQRSFSKLIVRLATAGVALSVAVMLISLATVAGFRSGIREKITGFSGHVSINALNNSNSLEQIPFLYDANLGRQVRMLPQVANVSAVAQKPGIIKGEEDLDGIVLKGVDTHYRWEFLQQALVQGRLPVYNPDPGKAEVLISAYTAKRLNLKSGDRLRVLFIRSDSSGNNRSMAVGPRISGIYDTGLEEQDRLMAYTSLPLLQQVFRNGMAITQWDVHLRPDYLSGNATALQDAAEQIHGLVPPGMRALSIYEQQPQLFEWLGYLDTNVEIIIALMILVAAINMCIALLILIMERTNMIGLLKAFGAGNPGIRRIFLFHSAYIILFGLFLGNLAGLGFCWLQDTYGFIRLSKETYYVDRVLVEVIPWQVLLVNLITFVLILLVLFLPATLITRLSPARTIRFN